MSESLNVDKKKMPTEVPIISTKKCSMFKINLGMKSPIGMSYAK